MMISPVSSPAMFGSRSSGSLRRSLFRYFSRIPSSSFIASNFSVPTRSSSKSSETMESVSLNMIHKQ